MKNIIKELLPYVLILGGVILIRTFIVTPVIVSGDSMKPNLHNGDLLLERKEILRSNGFINKLQPRFEAICERLQEIDNETQKKLWGEVVLKDSEDEDIDFSFRDTSENVFQEALKTYCDNNKSRREYEKRMGMITDEERLRVKEFIEQLEAQRKKPQ